MTDRVQQARERAALYLAHGFIPRKTSDMDVCADVLFLADRVATLETALRYALDCIESPDIEHEPGKDSYDTSMMRGAITRARAALAGSEEASANERSSSSAG